MKKQFATLLVILLTVSGFFSSCDNKSKQDYGELVFDSIPLNITEHLFGDTAKPACNLVISLAYAKQSADEQLKDSLNTYFLATTLGEEWMKLTPQEAVQQYKEQYVRNYRNDLEELYRKEEKEFGDADQRAWYSYYKYVRSQVELYRKNLVVYQPGPPYPDPRPAGRPLCSRL